MARLRSPILAIGIAAYLADAREVTDPAAGSPIAGKVSVRLPEGGSGQPSSPTTGMRSPGIAVQGGSQPLTIDVGEFRHDIVLEVAHKNAK